MYPTDYIEIDEKDLMIDVYRKGGALPSHDTCIRIIHVPTGLTVTETKNASLEDNRQSALRKLQVLLARLRDYRNKIEGKE